jgi:hypothetical protein
MELTAEAARKLIDQTLAGLGDSPTPEELEGVSNRLMGMYEMLKVLPSFKASRYHPSLLPDAVLIEAMILEALKRVTEMQEQFGAIRPNEKSL